MLPLLPLGRADRLGQPRLSEALNPTQDRETALKGKPDDWLEEYIFRSRVSAVRYQVQVLRFGYRFRT